MDTQGSNKYKSCNKNNILQVTCNKDSILHRSHAIRAQGQVKNKVKMQTRVCGVKKKSKCLIKREVARKGVQSYFFPLDSNCSETVLLLFIYILIICMCSKEIFPFLR